MKKLISAALAALVFLSLGGCANAPSQAKIHPFDMPGKYGGPATIVTHESGPPAWARSTKSFALNYLVKGNLTQDQVDGVAKAEEVCREEVNTVDPGRLVSIAADAALYGVTGYIGVGLGARAITGAVSSQYAKYGGLAGAATGAAAGTVSSGGRLYTFENCGATIFHAFPGYQVYVLNSGQLY